MSPPSLNIDQPHGGALLLDFKCVKLELELEEKVENPMNLKVKHQKNNCAYLFHESVFKNVI